jgi:peptidoglycan-associated lipoprotein
MFRGWRVAGVIVVVGLIALSAGACRKKVPPVARPVPPPTAAPAPAPTSTAKPPAPPEPVVDRPVAPPPAMKEDKVVERTLDEINKNSPLKPVFFDYDSSEVGAEAQKTLDANAEVLKKNPNWMITIEGHCDERGTAEYNLALGERRAVASRTYLVSLGIGADRIRTVSYGKEFSFDAGHTEEAWARNRRDHFVVTQK